MRIMTWNINRFNGIWNSYHNGFDLRQKAREEYADKITDKLREFLVDENDIVVLQEVPYVLENNNEWEQLWKPTIEKKELFTFSNLDIGKKCNYNELWYTSYSQTIAMTTKESNWKSVEKIDKLNLKFDLDKNKRPFANKYVEMYNATIDMSLIGVHLNWEEEYWKKLAENANKFAVIVGDFNYNSLLKNDKNIERKRKEKYCEILKTHKQVMPEDLITDNQDVSGIDKFFLRNDLLEKSKYSISVLEHSFVRKTTQGKLRYSDHNLCICNIERIR